MSAPEAAPHIARLAPYALADLSAPPGKRPIQLAQNESALPPSPRTIEAATAAMADARLYPDPDWRDLRAAIAGVHALDPASILCGAGSMELIGALAAAYLAPGTRALTTMHGYLYFRTATRLAGAEIDVAHETGLHVDVEALLEHVGPETRLVFVADPGNPTGTRIGRTRLIDLRERLPSSVLLVIDEAYGEFADGIDPPMFDLAPRGDTVVLRTFSKAYGLAAMRVGWGVFPAKVAAHVRKALNPSNVSAAAQAAAAAAMRDQAYMQATCRVTAERRERFAKRMRAIGLDVPESHTNFVLLRFADALTADAAEAALRAEGILSRGAGGYGLPEALRLTIGSQADIAAAEERLAAFMQGEQAA